MDTDKYTVVRWFLNKQIHPFAIESIHCCHGYTTVYLSWNTWIYNYNLARKSHREAHKIRSCSHGLSSSTWSHGSWMYNYLCNHCLSPQTLEVRISIRRDVLDTTLCDEVCQWLAAGRWFSLSTPVSSTNKTDHHDITEILLKIGVKHYCIYQTKPNRVMDLFSKVMKRLYICYH